MEDQQVKDRENFVLRDSISLAEDSFSARGPFQGAIYPLSADQPFLHNAVAHFADKPAMSYIYLQFSSTLASSIPFCK